MAQTSNSESIAKFAVKGFTHDFSGREAMALGVFGGEGAGKTRFLATTTEWAHARNTVPAWLVFDRKTRKTVREIHTNSGWDLPLINEKDFITPKQALEIARLDRETESDKVQKVYTDVYKSVLDIVGPLCEDKRVNPICLETGTALYDVISYAHFGKKQGVGKSRAWGPPKQDWSDLLDLLAAKTTLISFWERDEYKDDTRTGKTKPDGPNHLGYTITSLVRLNHDRRAKDPDKLFTLDVVQSQDNVALEGEGGESILTGDNVTFTNLMQLLRPEDE